MYAANVALVTWELTGIEDRSKRKNVRLGSQSYVESVYVPAPRSAVVVFQLQPPLHPLEMYAFQPATIVPDA